MLLIGKQQFGDQKYTNIAVREGWKSVGIYNSSQWAAK